MNSQTASSAVLSGLWQDQDVLRLKLEKTVGVVLALGKSLAKVEAPTVEEREFLSLIHWSQTVPWEQFEAVFSDPRAYHWSRVAFDLVAGVHHQAKLSRGTEQYLTALGINDLSAALAYHLNQFNLFALSLAFHSGNSLSVLPTRLNLPEVLPATGWSFSCSEAIELCGIKADGSVCIRIRGKESFYRLPQRTTRYAEGLVIHRAAELESEGGKLTLQPHEFNVPGLRDIRSVSTADVEAQFEIVPTLQSALMAIESYAPHTHRQLTSYMKVIAFKPVGAGGAFNTSCSRLPGASTFTAAGNHLVLADDLIHEFFHNRLFALEEQFDFVDPDAKEKDTSTTYYSPWRDDPRPFYGLFHAAYVFERVHSFWISALQRDELTGMELAYARYRAAKLGRQLCMTLPQLFCWAPLSAVGREICEAVAESLANDLAVAESNGISGDVGTVRLHGDGRFSLNSGADHSPISVNDELRNHIATYDVHGRSKQFVREHFEQYSDFGAVIAELLPESC